MARRRPDGGMLDVIFEIAKLMPWQAGVTLAAISFGLLHWYATGDTTSPPPVPNISDMTAGIYSQMLKTIATVLQYVAPLVLLAGAIASYFASQGMSAASSIKGMVGEASASFAAKVFLDSKIYHSLNNVTLQTNNGTTQIDHVIVSRFGVFVVETKNYQGWIFGSENQAEWTQSLPGGKKFKFQNPLRQNYRHVKVLSEFLLLPEDKFHSMVMFWGESEFKTPMPANVMANNYSGYIKGINAVVFTEPEVEQIVAALKVGRMPTGPIKGMETRRTHLASLKERHSSITQCPKCGSALTERVAQSGELAGKRFLACTTFPKCRFTKDIVG